MTTLNVKSSKAPFTANDQLALDHDERQTQPGKNTTVLLVDDDVDVLKALRRILSKGPFNLLFASRAQVALDFLKKCPVDIVVSDQRMPEMTGIDLLSRIQKYQPHVVRILLTAHVEEDTLLRAINEAEIFRFVTKPFDSQELLETVVSASERRLRLLEASHTLGENEALSTNDSGDQVDEEQEWPMLDPDDVQEVTVQSDIEPSSQIAISEEDFLAAWGRVGLQ